MTRKLFLIGVLAAAIHVVGVGLMLLLEDTNSMAGILFMMAVAPVAMAGYWSQVGLGVVALLFLPGAWRRRDIAAGLRVVLMVVFLLLPTMLVLARLPDASGKRFKLQLLPVETPTLVGAGGFVLIYVLFFLYTRYFYRR